MGGRLAVLLLCAVAAADAIVVTKAMTASTIAEVFVTDGSVRVELEIGVPDLKGFRNLLPDALYEKLGYEAEPLAQRLPRFFEQDWVVKADGKPLPPKIREIEGRPRITRDEITGEPTGESKETVIFVAIEYPLTGRPGTLTLRGPRASIGFVVYHESLPVNDFRYLGGEETLDLDWEDPWYSKFRNRNLRRRYYAPIQAFLYVEAFEVRKEIVCRPRDLAPWLDLDLGAVIRADEQAALKEKIAAFLATKNPVTIDGKPVEMKLDRIHFIRRSLRMTSVIDPPEDLDAASATLGVIFFVATTGLPQEVTMQWELWTPRIQQLPTAATDEAGALPSTVTPDDPVLKWQNFLKNPSSQALKAIEPPAASQRLTLPLATIACVGLALVLRRRRRAMVAILVLGAALLPFWMPVPVGTQPALGEEQTGTVLSGLLHNTYRAFDRREESIVYDRLAASIAGDLLSKVYLQTRRSMELENQGGARVKVKQVDVVKFTHDPADSGFVSECTWNVSGSVGHWGHLHQRTNQYRAALKVEPVDGAWRITGLELLDETRLP
ncbi:MAG: hypothetical protein ACYTG3_07960 [Planctomycetota bacterium]|jgi:hypothetical protein